MRKIIVFNTIKSVTVLVFVFVLFGCRKAPVNNSPQLSDKINTVVSQAQIDTLQSLGMAINGGTVPPTIQGTFILNPNKLTYTYPRDAGTSVGKIFDDYSYKIYNQVSNAIVVDWADISTPGADVANNINAYLSGSGNLSSLFTKITSTSNTVSFAATIVISGEVASAGIKNFQVAELITSKTGDPNNTVSLPVGKGRVFADGNGLASKQ